MGDPSDRTRDVGALTLAATFLASFPPTARVGQERELASLDRVCEDGLLTVRVEQEGNELVVGASGELDIASAKRLEDELLQAIDSDASAVVLDLGGVSFIDSTGLRLLIFAAEHSRSKGVRLRMLPGSTQVREAIETSDVADLLPLGRASAARRRRAGTTPLGSKPPGGHQAPYA